MATTIRAQAAQEQTQERARFRISWRVVGTYALLLVVCVLVLFPIYWMLTISFKTPRDIYRAPSLFPTAPTLDNYTTLLDKKHFLVNIRTD